MYWSNCTIGPVSKISTVLTFAVAVVLMADTPAPRLDSLVLEALLCLVPIPEILSTLFKAIGITT